MTVRRADLDWWWGLAREMRWTWASTYANSAPHWYLIYGKVRGMSREDFLKVGELIRTYGTPGKFYRYTNLCEINPGGTHKAWCMWSDDPDGDDVHGINLARTDPQLRAADVLSLRRSSRGAATAFANRLTKCVGG